MLLILLGILALSKEVVLGINLRNRREPNEALVGRVLLSKHNVVDRP